MLTIVTNSLSGSATFDVSQHYRYSLSRFWTDQRDECKHVTFVMLNPSRANAEQDDPTIRACSQFSQAWGYACFKVVNLFAYRTPHPSNLQEVADPIGPENDRYLVQAAASADKVILAWGNRGNLMNRAQDILILLDAYCPKVYCLAQNHSGQPRHPLYIKRSTVPKLWDASTLKGNN